MRTYRNPANVAAFVVLTAALISIAWADESAFIAVLVALGIVYVAARNLWPKLTTTKTGITLRNYRTRTIDWTNIDDVTVRPRYGTDHLWITVNGTRIPCLAVSASPLGASWVARQAAAIRDVWQSSSRS